MCSFLGAIFLYLPLVMDSSLFASEHQDPMNFCTLSFEEDYKVPKRFTRIAGRESLSKLSTFYISIFVFGLSFFSQIIYLLASN